MAVNDYKDIIIQTIEENYNQKQLKKIFDKLIERNILSKEENLFTVIGTSIEVSGQNLKEDIKMALKHREQDVIRVIEKLEYNFGYKYSAYFEVENNFLDKLDELFNNRVINSHSESKPYDITTANTSNPYQLYPSYFKVADGVHAFKFSLKLSGYHGRENPIKATIKYPIIAYFFEEYKIIDIRLDSLKGYLKNGDEFFYTKQIERIANWFNTFCSKTKALNLCPIIEYISKNGCPDVNVAAQMMTHSTGSRTILDTGNDERAILPILGDLKKIIAENQKLFNSCNVGKEIKELLQDFINDIEETSDLPWISLRWSGNDGKSNIARVKFSFGYKGTFMDVLQYYDSSNTEMEKMNYVTKYIIDHQIEYKAKGNQQGPTGQVI